MCGPQSYAIDDSNFRKTMVHARFKSSGRTRKGQVFHWSRKGLAVDQISINGTINWRGGRREVRGIDDCSFTGINAISTPQTTTSAIDRRRKLSLTRFRTSFVSSPRVEDRTRMYNLLADVRSSRLTVNEVDTEKSVAFQQVKVNQRKQEESTAARNAFLIQYRAELYCF